jgi:hypothetical protein
MLLAVKGPDRQDGGVALQVCIETTIFMQKAIYYVSRLIAARGVLELTDCHLNFQVSHLDSSFGMRGVSIDLATVDDVRIEGGDLHPRVIISSGKDYEFVLPKAQELYDHLKRLCFSSVTSAPPPDHSPTIICGCGHSIKERYNFCPWCGTRLQRT